MELIQYLNDTFYSKQQLLDLAKITELELAEYQLQKVMPSCSYKLALNYTSDSFFGEFNQQKEIEYYAKGYLSWIGLLKATSDLKNIFCVFSKRYVQSIAALKTAGFYSNDEKVNSQLELHIKAEWQHFLNGIYGLCTNSGLPEDIAAKEIAILQINEIIALDNLNEADQTKLRKAVNLLDSASSMFAPHERLRSSRHRLINEVRRLYQLTN